MKLLLQAPQEYVHQPGSLLGVHSRATTNDVRAQNWLKRQGDYVDHPDGEFSFYRSPVPELYIGDRFVAAVSPDGLHIFQKRLDDSWQKTFLLLPFQPLSVFGKGNTLLVVLAQNGIEPEEPFSEGKGIYKKIHPCSIGFNCKIPQEQYATHLVTFDVTEPLLPRKKVHFSVPGVLSTMRIAGSMVQAVVSRPQAAPPSGWEPINIDLRGSTRKDPDTRQKIMDFYRDLQEKNEKKMADTSMDPLLPWYADEEGVRHPVCGKMFRPSGVSAGGQSTLLSLDLSTGTPRISTLLEHGFASFQGDSLIIHNPRQPVSAGCRGFSIPREQHITTLYRFEPGPDGAFSGRSFGVIPGAITGDQGITLSGDRWHTFSVFSSIEAGRFSVLREVGAALLPEYHRPTSPLLDVATFTPGYALWVENSRYSGEDWQKIHAFPRSGLLPGPARLFEQAAVPTGSWSLMPDGWLLAASPGLALLDPSGTPRTPTLQIPGETGKSQVFQDHQQTWVVVPVEREGHQSLLLYAASRAGIQQHAHLFPQGPIESLQLAQGQLALREAGTISLLSLRSGAVQTFRIQDGASLPPLKVAMVQQQEP
ncbi:MAG: beta-propeller domain-containing protein [Polyangiaceae bacterium]|nr:beta-propeller domain-containing protein [Polyangiaceae bacterium]